MATEMETTTVAVPAVLAVRVEVRVPAARTAAPYTSLPRHLPSTAMCLCVRLQNLHESTPIEMANTIAVPIATAVRVEVRACV